MCNAWNHRPGCTCGWGGFGHLGGRSQYAAFAAGPRTWDSYVNPSARCPVCGAAVYFFQSASGGRVFFDHLGPPWPKHPCTDNGRPLTSLDTRSGSTIPNSAPPPWAEAGWTPLLEVSATDLTPALIRLEAELQKTRLVMYVPKYLMGTLLNPIIELKTLPAHIKPAGDGVYRIELLNSSGRPLEILAFTSMAEALARAESRIPLRKSVTLVVRKR